MNHHNNTTGFWVLDLFLFLTSIALGVVGYFVELIAPQIGVVISNVVHLVSPQLNVVLSLDGFDEWLKRIVLILSGLGALAAIIFAYLNYQLNKKKSK